MSPESTAPLRVLLLTDADVFAGTERHILSLACALRGEAIDVLIGCPFPSLLADEAKRAGIEIVPIAKRGFVDWRAARILRGVAQSQRISIIHAHNGRTALAAAIGLRGLSHPRLVVTQHFLDPAHARRRGPAACLSGIAHRWMNARIDRVIAISRAVADSIQRRGDVEARRVAVIHNGIPDCAAEVRKPAGQVRRELGIQANAPLIVCAARLEPEKDVGTLILAMQKLRSEQPEIQCVIAGRGSLADRLSAQIKSLGLENHVHLHGFTSDVPSLIGAADVLALPSLAEPFGLVILEAMALGKPVVATRAGGPVEIVEDGATGLLVPPSDAPALAAAIGHLIRDRDAADNMGRQGRARYQAHFTAAAMAAATANVYRELVNHDRAKSS